MIPIASGFKLGIGATGFSAQAIWASPLAYATTHKLVVRYTVDAGCKLWVNPSSESDTSIEPSVTVGGTVSKLALYQARATPSLEVRISSAVVSMSTCSGSRRCVSIIRQRVIRKLRVPFPASRACGMWP